MKKKLFISIMIVLTAVIFTACGSLNKDALHINYSEDDNYGSGDYLFSTITFSGSGFDSESIYSVKELEQLALEKKELAYEGTYSMLTRGSVFSTHKMTGIKLYDMLLYAGMDPGMDEDTDVKLMSTDGYTCVMSLGEIKDSTDNTYESIEESRPSEENVPVILALGSDGVPLTGPVGVREPGEDVPESEGFIEEKENVGGPVRLIAGQKSSDEYNAPDNAKWLREVVVGDTTQSDRHQGSEADKNCLGVSVTDKEGNTIDSKEFSFKDIESFEGKEANYYGKENYYKGVNLWEFLASSMEFASREGTVKLQYNDGSTDVLDMSYFRNIKGDFSGYITKKDGLTITNVKPALGFSVNGKPSKQGIYGLLPEAKGYLETSRAKLLTSIELHLTGDDALTENPYGSSKIVINGEGIDKERAFTVNHLESYSDLLVTSGDKTGISLAGILEETGLTVDAEEVIVKGDREVVYKYGELDKNRDSIFLVTRERGKTPQSGGPVKLGDVNNVTEITVNIKDGKWTHSEKPYSKYLKTTLKISGSEADKTKKYTLGELEAMSQYTAKDSFGASKGINGYQGIILRQLIEDNLKEGLDKPSRITVIGKDGYKTEVAVDDVMKGVTSQYQTGEHRDVIIAYSIDGEPLVKDEKSKGFTGKNGYGPMRLVVENQISKWVKNVKEVKIGD